MGLLNTLLRGMAMMDVIHPLRVATSPGVQKSKPANQWRGLKAERTAAKKRRRRIVAACYDATRDRYVWKEEQW